MAGKNDKIAKDATAGQGATMALGDRRGSCRGETSKPCYGAKESSDQRDAKTGQAKPSTTVKQAQIADDDDDDDDDDSFGLCEGEKDATGRDEHDDEHEQEGHADFKPQETARDST
ncbi:hypothetical protein VDGE_30688 [Verticillium dahliae]|uniref:Uncharacterized protein n=1 Tax=Verticillium dahliae TaxID=27337 RepID=A0A444RST7_VERDA|nr:hypothetical protein VDGE_30688 [Verticillium dahliae]